MEIQTLLIDKLNPAKYNPRLDLKPGDKEYDKLFKVITEFDLVEPLVWNKRTGNLVGGHQRLKILQERGDTEVDVSIVDLPLDKEKALNLALNKTGGDWDLPKLKDLLEELDVGDFDPEITGFDDGEIENLMTQLHQPEIIEDEAPEPPEEARTVLGDVYKLGNHRLMCGNSTVITDVERLMDNNKADMVFTDPPYNVNYSNADRPKPSKKDLGIIKNDKMDVSVFKEFIVDILNNAILVTKPASSLYLWYASASASAILNAFDESGWKRSQEIIWNKPMLLGRSRYQWAHEPCIFAVKGQPFFIEDRTKTTVWDIGGYDKSKNVHPTQKPVKICAEGLQNSSRQEDVVLDLFGGSGSTLIAAEQLNRKCYVMELDAKYCDVIIERYRRFKELPEDWWPENG